MDNADEMRAIRHANLLLLIGKHKSQEDLADLLKMSATQLSALKVQRRGVGEAMARRVERQLSLEPGWMDVPHGTVSALSTTDSSGHVEIRYHGRDSSAMKAPLLVPTEWLAAENLDPAACVVIDAPDESQSDRIRAGDPVIVNTDYGGAIESGRTYAIYLGDNIHLRRILLRADGGATLKCRNPDFDDDVLTADQLERLSVLGLCKRAVIDL